MKRPGRVPAKWSRRRRQGETRRGYDAMKAPRVSGRPTRDATAARH